MLPHDPDFRDPRDLLAYFLEILRRATVQADFDTYQSRIALPHEITSSTGTWVIETEADIRGVYDGIQNHMRSIGATDQHRSVTSASFDGPDRVVVTYTGSWVVAGRHLVGAYSTRALIIREDGIWKSKSGAYDVDHMPLLKKAMSLPERKPLALPSDAGFDKEHSYAKD